MKRRVKEEGLQAKAQAGPDIVGLINSLQQQLSSIDRKIDSLISRSQPKPPEIKTFPSNLQFPPRPPQPVNNQQQDNRPRERMLYKAVCADCKNGCEVPFKPSGDRPVYCKDCFSKRKSANSFKPKPDNRIADSKYSQPQVSNKKEAEEARKPADKKPVEKKKPAPKKRKAKK